MDTQARPAQAVIEEKMREIVNYGNYEAVYLFSTEGLYIARAEADGHVDPDRLAEISLLFTDIRRLATTIGSIDRLKEVFMEGYNRSKIIFRFFRAFEEDVVLAAVIPPGRTYRKHTNDLQRLINAIQF